MQSPARKSIRKPCGVPVVLVPHVGLPQSVSTQWVFSCRFVTAAFDTHEIRTSALFEKCSTGRLAAKTMLSDRGMHDLTQINYWPASTFNVLGAG